MKTWTVAVEQAGDELVITLPDEVMEHLGVHPGDGVVWRLEEVDGETRVTLAKAVPGQED